MNFLFNLSIYQQFRGKKDLGIKNSVNFRTFAGSMKFDNKRKMFNIVIFGAPEIGRASCRERV